MTTNQLAFVDVHQAAHQAPVAWCPYCPTFWETALEAALRRLRIEAREPWPE